MRTVVYTPEYLGSQPVMTDELENPYQLALFSHLTQGGLNGFNERKIIPITDSETHDAIQAQSACRDSIIAALDNDGKTTLDLPKVKALQTALRSLDSTKPPDPDLYNNSYQSHNPYSAYDERAFVRSVVRLPTGLRSFVLRAGELQKAITSPSTIDIDFRRFETIEDIQAEFPGLKLAKNDISPFERKILDAIYGEGEMPSQLTSVRADSVISLIGGGTLLNALMQPDNEDMSCVEINIKALAKKVERTMGRSAFRLTVLGRAAWGAHSIRLRSGDTMPQVTLPKPGI